MRKLAFIATLLACAPLTTASALDSGAAAPVIVTPVRTTTVTSTGQPISLPQGNVEVSASLYDIAPGATLPVHKHPFARYGYVLSGTLKVTNVDTGKSDVFKTGDFIVEMIDQWHQGSNIGADPVRLLVIDQIEPGAKATVLRE
jgi:quercetin dioxygenase-like cupin family protein